MTAATPAARRTRPASRHDDAAWHALSPEEALRQQGVDVEHGLTSAEADARRAKVRHEHLRRGEEGLEAGRCSSASTPTRCRSCCSSPASSACSCPASSIPASSCILLTLFNAWMAMNQEGKAEASASALQSMMVVKAKVRRDGELAEIPMDQLVPGDIVNIEAGDLVPADARILTAATLEIDESALTGESVPTPKQVDAVAADAALGDRVDMAFMNCQVTRGAGTILVTTTGHGDRGRPHQRHAPGDGHREDAADQAARRADQPDPDHRRRRAGHLDRARPVPRRPAPGAVPERGRVRGGGHPDGAPGRRHGHPVEGLADRSPTPARS